MTKTFRWITLVVAILTLLFSALQVEAALITVTPTSLNGWVIAPGTASPIPTNAFVNGPATPPLGTGSFYTEIAANPTGLNTKILIGRSDFPPGSEQPLSQLTALSYSTYVDPTSTTLNNFYINVYLDTNGDNAHDVRIDYIPNNNAVVSTGVWQNWDAALGSSVWFVNTLVQTRTLTQILALFPTARVINPFPGGGNVYPGIVWNMGDTSAGCGYCGFRGNLDNATIGFTTPGSNTWNFELLGAPASITATAGTPQSAMVNTAFGAQLEATVRDNANNPLPNITVTFTEPVAGASVTFPAGNTAVTDSNGVARVPVQANGSEGVFAVSANVTPPLRISAVFDLTNTAAPVTPPPPPPPPPSSDAPPVVTTFADSSFIVKAVDKSLVMIGDSLIYTITYFNPKGNTLNNVVIMDVFDSRLQVQNAVSNVGNVTVSGNSVIIQGFSLTPGQQAALTVMARVSEQAQPGDVILNSASLESPDASIHISNTVSTTILPGSLPGTGESAMSKWRKVIVLLVLISLIAFGAMLVKKKLA